MEDWAKAEAQLRRLVADTSRPIDAAIVSVTEDFLGQIHRSRQLPELGIGYWNTIVLHWPDTSSPSIQVEIFADHLELYRLFDGRSDIAHFPHACGQPLPEKILNDIPPSP